MKTNWKTIDPLERILMDEDSDNGWVLGTRLKDSVGNRKKIRAFVNRHYRECELCEEPFRLKKTFMRPGETEYGTVYYECRRSHPKAIRATRIEEAKCKKQCR